MTGRDPDRVGMEDLEANSDGDYYDNEDDDDYSDFFPEDDDDDNNVENDYDLLQAQFDKADLPTGVEVTLPSLINLAPSFSSENNSSPICEDEPDNQADLSSCSGITMDNLLEIVQFPRFDVVDSFPDHHYANFEGFGTKSYDKGWARRIHKEWTSLSKDLPETIFVRVAEDRMDLLRAALVGPVGTPYHGGLFFFDCHFPPQYPNVPPMVYYHSGGLRINPNLYNCGKVCLSLLGTWSGLNSENWIPSESTMLQVLVSIQALILNERPFFNEPGYESHYKGENGKRRSNEYNEKVFNLSLKTMVYSLRKPPQHFDYLVTSHFRKHGRHILEACKTYGINNVSNPDLMAKFKIFDRPTDKSSDSFRIDVTGMMNILVACFTRVGTPNCDEFRLSHCNNFTPSDAKKTKWML